MGALGRVYRVGKGGAKVIAFWGGVMLVISAAMIGAGDLIGSVGDSQPTTTTSDPDSDGIVSGGAINETAAESALLHAINDRRADAGRQRLARSDGLHDAAHAHARDMHEREFYAHENPDGEQPWDRAACRASENIHRGDVASQLRGYKSSNTFDTTTADGISAYVASGWVNSPDHRENMLRPEWREIGIGIVIQDGEFFATAMFC
jgi:uncharacterized protein YkwD